MIVVVRITHERAPNAHDASTLTLIAWYRGMQHNYVKTTSRLEGDCVGEDTDMKYES